MMYLFDYSDLSKMFCFSKLLFTFQREKKKQMIIYNVKNLKKNQCWTGM